MLARPNPSVVIFFLILLTGLVALPFVAGTYPIKLMTRIIILATFVLSLDLLIGITGLVSFGHGAFFGCGAYAVYFVSPESEAANAFVALGAGFMLATALVEMVPESLALAGRNGAQFLALFNLLGAEPDYSGAIAAIRSAEPLLRLSTAVRARSKPDVSIVIPAYGQLAYTLNCIHSLITHRSRYSAEILIIDDGLTPL